MRREQANREPALGDPTSEWMDVGGRRMFVVGFTSGGAPYGCYEDEFDAVGDYSSGAGPSPR